MAAKARGIIYSLEALRLRPFALGEYPADFTAQVLERRFQNRAPGIKDDSVATGDPVKLASNRRPHAPLQAIPHDGVA
jgi:hypothetical protein